MRKKLIIRLLLLLFCVILISAAAIYFTFDIRAIDYLALFQPSCILLALGSLAVGLFFDGLRLVTLTQVTDEELSYREVVNVVLSNYFLALVTPGASGGAIAQVMFMRRAGVPVAKATVVILVRTVMSIFFLILLVPVVLFSDRDIVTWVPSSVLFLVSLLFTALPVGIFFLMRTELPERLIYFFTGRFSHRVRRRSFNLYHDFKMAFVVMGRHPFKVVRAFAESGLSLLFIYGTVPAYFTGLHFPFDLSQVMGRMILINLVLYFSPTPGGSGIAEAGFCMLFTNLLPAGTEGIMAVLWRFTAEYLPFLLGAVVSIRAFGSNILSIATSKEAR